MKIALLNPTNPQKKAAMNKDLAGGFGTLSVFGDSLISKLLTKIKKKKVNLPVLSIAQIQAILKDKGHKTTYIENNSISNEYDLILIYGSIVDFKNELNICKKIKQNNKTTKVGFFGPFPSIKPEIFKEADFVIAGDAESFFLSSFNSLKSLNGIIKIDKQVELNYLPTPDFDNFPINKYSYFPAITEKPLLVLQASRGCPYTCSYYCPYGAIQGQRYHIRDAEKIIEDILTLKTKYGLKGLQFRDPTFGLNKNQIIKLANLLIEKRINIKWGIETRLDLLDNNLLKLMFKAGLRNINVGIETTNENIASQNKRQLIKTLHQESIIKYCKKIGVKVSAFYIFGLTGDTKESIKKTIDYAIKLNTNVAQFTISCPYPGTKYYKELESQGNILEKDFEKFNGYNLVSKHDKLTNRDLLILKDYAFKKYYFRPRYLLELLKWQIKGF